MDVINLISKVPGLPDVPITDPKQTYQVASKMYANGSVLLLPVSFCLVIHKLKLRPKVHEYIREMNNRVLSRMYLSVVILDTPY